MSFFIHTVIIVKENSPAINTHNIHHQLNHYGVTKAVQCVVILKSLAESEDGWAEWLTYEIP
jgi:hypothetical protein